eukprot:CAMPEP_0172540826 /NCGR_PEP_ID=MMETSP1067-20121228/11757_1 /TAXON_ID=265564 ORGANISM="Thalassiosira punctigera, Strain Tpunct2005C2" /NCGR_SAMPLE_ID=MMETSP1067 /ASSEMBLY_ACC=CAM_ASM_000444 /LENGTH=52 /DNA_ID=CAMNT_0013326745 /DNA_START=98 /DNA_END=253 /DNA_ORIENTATION=+
MADKGRGQGPGHRFALDLVHLAEETTGSQRPTLTEAAVANNDVMHARRQGPV